MTTLREAAQQALEALKDCVKALDALHAPGDSIYTRASDLADRAEIALRAALAQQEQEPKAWMLTDDSGMRFVSVDRPHPDFVPLYTTTHRREWQSLSEEEIKYLAPEDDIFGAIIEFSRAVEAALKEKNQ